MLYCQCFHDNVFRQNGLKKLAAVFLVLYLSSKRNIEVKNRVVIFGVQRKILPVTILSVAKTKPLAEVSSVV